MIKVTVSSNMERKTEFYEPTTTIREILDSTHIDYMNGGVHLDGCALVAGDFDKTLSDFGVTEKCYLTRITKGDGACK